MHNNYFLLKKLSAALSERLNGFEFAEIFSQNKDELVIGLVSENDSFYIKANLDAQFSCLNFPDNYARARKNSVDLFQELIGRKVGLVRVAKNDRCLIFEAGDHTLLFKMYGNRSNVILFKDGIAISIFKKKLDKDIQLLLYKDFDKELDLSFDNFKSNIDDLNKFIPTLTKKDLNFLMKDSTVSDNPEKTYQHLIRKINELETDKTFISYEDGLPRLQVYSSGEQLESFSNPIQAINAFYIEYSKTFFLGKKKQQLLQVKNKEIKKAENYLEKTRRKKDSLHDGQTYRQMADILMANLHSINKGSESAELHNFYNNALIKIPLKKELSPQKNAEVYYRKSKNQNIEVEKLAANIRSKEKELKELISQVKAIEEEGNHRNLDKFKKEKASEIAKELPYHLLELKDCQILVGKNAKNNDILTFKIADKNDTWLHVKDAPGSHVVIRNPGGKTVSQDAIEKAASLAAWYSKRKTEGLVPVICTERKFVRKTKDLQPGQVIVQKEKVVLAEPKNWLSKD